MAQRTANGAPIVFIASTAKDLAEYREAAADAARRAGFHAILAEDWEARDKKPLDACMEKVDTAHLTVVIVAHRYGWVPPDQEGEKSITWLECERTTKNEKNLLAFVHEDAETWPKEKLEKFRLMEAMDDDSVDPAALREEIKQNEQALDNFKAWLGARIYETFTDDPKELAHHVEVALREWLYTHPGFRSALSTAADPNRYFNHLLRLTSHIDIRGLGGNRAHNFPINELYVELSTDRPSPRRRSQIALESALSLEDELSEQRLVVIGDPGSGKTTFLRRVAHALTKRTLGESLSSDEGRWIPEISYLPVLVSVSEWLEHIDTVIKQHRRERHPTTTKDPQWLTHYLGEYANNNELELDADWFRSRLKAGEAMIFLDGLDEAADRQGRERAVKLINALAGAYPDCPIVVTSRPLSVDIKVVLPDFHTARIQPMSDTAVETFLGRWSEALFRDDNKQALAHRNGLIKALNARPNIRRLARNMVMLTALAVVHWNEKRLPEQRAELYESILIWLARSREARPGRPSSERCLEALRRLALEMLNSNDGRQVQVPRRWAAELLASMSLFKNNADAAEHFLSEEELDSGIIVRRGYELRFWHLTFQEYLAARAIGGLSEAKQQELLLKGDRPVYAQEWRETILLLGGVLHEQGVAKVDGLISALFDDLQSAEEPELPDAARAAGLVGALVRDLAPYGYTPTDIRYQENLERVMTLFTPEGAAKVPVESRIVAADALGQAGDPRIEEDVEEHWIFFAGASFLMGAQSVDPSAENYDPEADSNEMIRHVTVSPFRLARRPVTVAEFARFIDDGGYRDPRWWAGGVFGKEMSSEDWDEQSLHPNRPVTRVSWYDAVAYCAWLTERHRHQGRIGLEDTIRLPTEAEWEWAARGEARRRFPWGNDEPSEERLNFNDNVGAPTPVGIYPLGHTPEGLEDMAGNVREWCVNEYYNPKQNNTGSGGSRVMRSGSWSYNWPETRCTSRLIGRPNGRGAGIGFRVLLASKPVNRKRNRR